jgi:hypothetical protein
MTKPKNGWWLETLLKILKSFGMIIPNIWKKKCSKPPNRRIFYELEIKCFDPFASK